MSVFLSASLSVCVFDCMCMHICLRVRIYVSVYACLFHCLFVSSGPPARDLAYGQSCVTHVIEFMRKHQHIPEIQATGCLLVMGLCRNHGENHQEVDEVNGLEALLGALRDHSVRDTDVAYYSLQCLAVMSVPGESVLSCVFPVWKCGGYSSLPVWVNGLQHPACY